MFPLWEREEAENGPMGLGWAVCGGRLMLRKEGEGKGRVLVGVRMMGVWLKLACSSLLSSTRLVCLNLLATVVKEKGSWYLRASGVRCGYMWQPVSFSPLLYTVGVAPRGGDGSGFCASPPLSVCVCVRVCVFLYHHFLSSHPHDTNALTATCRSPLHPHASLPPSPSAGRLVHTFSLSFPPATALPRTRPRVSRGWRWVSCGRGGGCRGRCWMRVCGWCWMGGWGCGMGGGVLFARLDYILGLGVQGEISPWVRRAYVVFV